MTKYIQEEGVSREIAQAFADQFQREGLPNVYHSTMVIDSIKDKPVLLGGCPTCGRQECIAQSCVKNITGLLATAPVKSTEGESVRPTALCKTCKHKSVKCHIWPCSSCTHETIGERYEPVSPLRIKI